MPVTLVKTAIKPKKQRLFWPLLLEGVQHIGHSTFTISLDDRDELLHNPRR
ncbi:hypothetical protein CB4_00817 [Aneurinibacillus soli]|uniref:Uncharacterized protein n=1 Tax=Aneurinibacillus soli TaxID=1500254 RepID=A0A0U5C4L5_9BACL|nr:hypothetical protein CB4_00817 [Aneurinibacillus soli]